MAVYQKVFTFVSLKASIVLAVTGFGALYISLQHPNQLLFLDGPVWKMIYASIGFTGALLACEAWAERTVKSFLFKQSWINKRIDQMRPPRTWLDTFKNRFNGGITEREALYFGRGFYWRQEHVQMLYDIDLDVDLKTSIDDKNMKVQGLPTYHAVGAHRERDMFLPYSNLPGHVGVEGTTRVGKSRLLESIATQQIQLPNGCIIVIEPKGDLKLADVLYDTCVQQGRPRRFKMFSLVHDLGTINPLLNYDEPSDIANRLIRMITTGSEDSDSFTNFALGELITVCEAMDYLDVPMSIKTIHRFLNLEMTKKDYLNRVSQLAAKDGSERGKAVVEGLKRVLEHPSDHYKKLIVNITPILEMLSTGPMENLLCSETPTISFENDIEAGSVILFSLASMVNKTRAEQVAKILLEDLTSYFGRTYAYKDPSEFKDIYLHADEIGDYMSSGYLNLLNKGGGAKLQSFNYFQAEEDAEVALGSSPEALKAFSNMNTRVWLRTLSKAGIANLVEDSPMTKIVMTQETTTRQARPDDPNLLFSAGVNSRTTPEEVPLVDGRWLKTLPVGEAFMFTGGKYSKIKLPLIEDPVHSFVRENNLLEVKDKDIVVEDKFEEVVETADLEKQRREEGRA